jgi:hypothetical protein
MREPFNFKKIKMMVQFLVEFKCDDDAIRTLIRSCIHAPLVPLNQAIKDARDNLRANDTDIKKTNN